MAGEEAATQRRLARIVIIGVGNPLRGDDGAGPAVAALLKNRVPAPVEIRLCDGNAADLIEGWTGRGLALIADAVRSGAEPGTVRRIDATSEDVPALPVGSSTHGLGLAEAVAMGRVLDRLPEKLLIYGIEGSSFTQGQEPSPAVTKGVQRAAERILAEIENSPHL